jgi:ADP-ribose pyrophosphatase YjhB (NUDIX family)
MNQREGLPQHLFDYVSSVTPLLNVDVIVIDRNSNFMLTWRDDGIYGPGWHVPGGIIRFKESIISRINQVCAHEIGINSIVDIRPVDINQIMNPTRDLRGHFLSILFLARVSFVANNIANHAILGIENGERSWFSKPPDIILPQHRRYLPVLSNLNICTQFNFGNILDDYSEFSETNY